MKQPEGRSSQGKNCEAWDSGASMTSQGMSSLRTSVFFTKLETPKHVI